MIYFLHLFLDRHNNFKDTAYSRKGKTFSLYCRKLIITSIIGCIWQTGKAEDITLLLHSVQYHTKLPYLHY